ncbi:MAG TPA: hypothetical protein VFX03_01775, partial [Thermomicrobiales bacterium]|nr:hypothetical protein [Thermomicrobiales bacterium]
WNALTRGDLPPATDGSPLVETLWRLHEADDAPTLPPDRQARIWRDLMAGRPAEPTLVVLGPFPPASPNGHRQPPPLAVADAPRRRWPASALATAAVVALMLASVLLTMALWQPNRWLRPAAAPPPVTTAVAPDASVQVEPLLAARFAEIPADARWVGVERYTAAPGAAWRQGAPEMSGVGPMLYRIERGAVTVAGDGAFEVTRAGDADPNPIGPGTTVALAGGDVAFMPSGVVTRWRNDGSDPAVILDAGVTTVGSADLSMLAPYAMPINDWGVVPPKAPVDFAVNRITIAPGETLRQSAAASMKLLAVESGTVDLVWSQPIADALQAAAAAKTAATDQPNQLTDGHWIDINQPHQFASELRNAGPGPLVLLVLTAEPTDAQAAPANMVAAP